MSTSLKDHLTAGAALRYRKGFGFYVVKQGASTPVPEPEAVQSISNRTVRPVADAQPDKFGVYHFAYAGSK